MTSRTLIKRSLRFHARAHLGVILGAAVGSAALIGALLVGDSVRESLREMALQRLGWVDAAMAPSDRFFTQTLVERLEAGVGETTVREHAHIATVLKLPGMAARQDGTSRANQVNVLGVTNQFWGRSSDTNGPSTFDALPKGGVIFNEALASHLNARPGEDVILRIHKPAALSRDVPITPQSDASVALRLKVHAIAKAAQMGNFNLQSGQGSALNAFVRIEELAAAAGMEGKANVMLVGQFIWPASWKRMYGGSPIEPKRWRPSPGKPLSPSETASFFDGQVYGGVTLGDLSLELRPVAESELELRSSRIFIDPAIVAEILQPLTNEFTHRPATIRSTAMVIWRPGMSAQVGLTNARPILTYLVNQLRAADRMTPYSMVTAAGPPWTPADLSDDEIIINQWLANDLGLKTGDALDFTYFLPESGASLLEHTNRFRVRSIVPLEGIYADRTLMPEFPGLAKAESTHDWDAGFPLVHKIREQDEQYWKDHRGTPKAFISFAAGQQIWANRFGSVTSIRFPIPTGEDAGAFQTNLAGSVLPKGWNSLSLGLRFEPVRDQALAASTQSQDFGGLFIGFSFFLILAALILMALLFQFGLEQRTNEIGTLLALGFSPKKVRRLLLLEGTVIAFIGGIVGVAGGIGYARAMLYGLTTLWRDAVGGSSLHYHATAQTIVIGLLSSVVVSAITIAIVLRKQARRPARELLAEGADSEFQITSALSQKRSIGGWLAIVCGLGAIGLVGAMLARGDTANPGAFFGAGALLLIAGLGVVAAMLAALGRSAAANRLSVTAMGLRGCVRRRRRSVATVALLACGTFIIIAVGANRLEANRDATKRSAGTGGFALIGQSTLPVLRDLNTDAGRDFFGLDKAAMNGVSVVPFRVRDGDEASCLNLNRAQTPRLLGVRPELLSSRGAFSFAKLLKDSITPALSPPRGEGVANGWMALKRSTSNIATSDEVIPAIGDAASIQWALGKKIGDILTFRDERGRELELVAGLANSILQGSLIIDEEQFLKKFPGESGYRMFLIDAPSNTVTQVSALLTRALQDVGLELTRTTQRLAAFNAVQNTYLSTFQVLGGLGLLLGSAGLGVVVLRNVFERRGELALLRAVGFRRKALHWLVLSEHGGLLWLGLGVGIVAALVAILPVLLVPGAQMDYTSLGITLLAVFLSGMLWTWVATRLALRGRLLDALRNE